MSSDEGAVWNLTLTVDGEGVVRVGATTPEGDAVTDLTLTTQELGLLLTTLLKGVLANEGDDVQTVSLN